MGWTLQRQALAAFMSEAGSWCPGACGVQPLGVSACLPSLSIPHPAASWAQAQVLGEGCLLRQAPDIDWLAYTAVWVGLGLWLCGIRMCLCPK